LGDALGCHDQSRLEEHLEEFNLEAADQEGVVPVAEPVFIGSIVIVGM
jgi:hypothetical protein